MKRIIHVAGLALFFTHGAFATEPPPTAPAKVCTWQDDDGVVVHSKNGELSVMVVLLNSPGDVTPNNRTAFIDVLNKQIAALEAKRCK